VIIVPDATLTGCGGLAAFGTFLREQGVDRDRE